MERKDNSGHYPGSFSEFRWLNRTIDEASRTVSLSILQELISKNADPQSVRAISNYAQEIVGAWDATNKMEARMVEFSTSDMTPEKQQNALSLSALYVGGNLFIEDRLNRMVSLSQEPKRLIAAERIRGRIHSPVTEMLSIRVGNLNLNDFLMEDFSNMEQEQPNLGSYYTLLMELILTNYDPEKKLGKILDHNENKTAERSQDQLSQLVLSVGTFADALAFLRRLEPENLSTNKQVNRTIRQKTEELLHKAGSFQGRVLAVLQHPESTEFTTLREAIQPYLLDEDENIKKLTIAVATRNASQFIGDLYRLAEYYSMQDVESEFYQNIMDTIETVTKSENKRMKKIDLLTEQEIPLILESPQETKEAAVPVGEIIDTAKTIRQLTARKELDCNPEVVKEYGLLVPDSLKLQFSEEKPKVGLIWQYQTEDGRSLELILQFDMSGAYNAEENFTWNFLPSPTNPQLIHKYGILRDVLLCATRQILEGLKNQLEESTKLSGAQKATVKTVPSPQRQATPSQPSVKVERDLISSGRESELRRLFRGLTSGEQQAARAAIQKYNEQGGNLIRLQLGGIRGGPYYGLNIAGGKIIALERLSESHLSVVAVDTLSEIARTIARK